MDWDMDDIFKHENARKIAASQKMDNQVKHHLQEERMEARMSTDPVEANWFSQFVKNLAGRSMDDEAQAKIKIPESREKILIEDSFNKVYLKSNDNNRLLEISLKNGTFYYQSERKRIHEDVQKLRTTDKLLFDSDQTSFDSNQHENWMGFPINVTVLENEPEEDIEFDSIFEIKPEGNPPVIHISRNLHQEDKFRGTDATHFDHKYNIQKFFTNKSSTFERKDVSNNSELNFHSNPSDSYNLNRPYFGSDINLGQKNQRKRRWNAVKDPLEINTNLNRPYFGSDINLGQKNQRMRQWNAVKDPLEINTNLNRPYFGSDINLGQKNQKKRQWNAVNDALEINTNLNRPYFGSDINLGQKNQKMRQWNAVKDPLEINTNLNRPYFGSDINLGQKNQKMRQWNAVKDPLEINTNLKMFNTVPFSETADLQTSCNFSALETTAFEKINKHIVNQDFSRSLSLIPNFAGTHFESTPKNTPNIGSKYPNFEPISPTEPFENQIDPIPVNFSHDYLKEYHLNNTGYQEVENKRRRIDFQQPYLSFSDWDQQKQLKELPINNFSQFSNTYADIENSAFLTDNKCRVIPSEYSNNQLPLELPFFEYDDIFTNNDLLAIAPQNCQTGLETGETETPDASGNYELHPHVKIFYDQYLSDMIDPLKDAFDNITIQDVPSHDELCSDISFDSVSCTVKLKEAYLFP
ncbi:hypothetical protein CDAR_455961 [Caerostris darwini]|uniref:Uncharacterized protein n=1 Tax=Caerostris darwini TaxID=1538125 RepID=A0AAV4RPW4_9ARAC|nr:hypothetical protein CDAR_455961 [Caerostris darwini]